MRARAAVLVAAGIILSSGALAREGDPGATAAAALPDYMRGHAGPLPGAVYDEYTAYSPVVRRRYVTGYEPAVTPRFMNPREQPAGWFKWRACEYTRGGLSTHYFGRLASPYENSGAPWGSHALAYLRGETGVTANLGRGYPYGQRVVEPVLMPYQGFGSPSGYFIYGGTESIDYANYKDRPATGCPDAIGPYGVPTTAGGGATAVGTVGK